MRVLKITDRKQLLKHQVGNIAPQVIENRMKRSPFIEQIMVIGEGEKMPSALINLILNILKIGCQEIKLKF